MAKRILPYAFLLLMLAALVPLKGRFNPDIGPRVYDGDYFYGIARHVAEGQGLATNLSLYFQGFQEFPHRVTTSPVWPLTLGGVGAATDLRKAATALPEFLYFVDLVLLYFLANALWRGIRGNQRGWLFRSGWIPNFGHVAVFVLATNVVFFRFTSVPNNEALAFAWLFAALLALDRAAREASAGWALAAGLLAGVTLLTRPQLIGLAAAVPLVLAWCGLGHGKALRLGGVAAVGVLAPLVPWVVYLASWMDPLTPGAALGLETQRATPELAVFPHVTSPPTAWAYFMDRLGGLGVAFDPDAKHAYTFHFNAIAYLVPLALVPVCAHLLRRRPRPPRSLPARYALATAMLATGAVALAPVHLHHSTFALPWLFGYRHGLPLLLLILPALAYLDSHTHLAWRLAATALLALTLVGNTLGMQTLLNKNYRSGLRGFEPDLILWLDKQSPRPSVVTTRSMALSVFSRSGYHWILCQHAPEQTLSLLRDAGADYVVVFAKDRKCNFVRGLRPRELGVVRTFGKGAIYVLGLNDRTGDAASRRRRNGR